MPTNKIHRYGDNFDYRIDRNGHRAKRRKGTEAKFQRTCDEILPSGELCTHLASTNKDSRGHRFCYRHAPEDFRKKARQITARHRRHRTDIGPKCKRAGCDKDKCRGQCGYCDDHYKPCAAMTCSKHSPKGSIFCHVHRNWEYGGWVGAI